MEETGSLDVMQAAYRKDHNVAQSLLYFLLSTTEAFKKRQIVVATFVDFEGAFDAVWHNGAILRLHEAGICDKMLLFLSSFLEERQSRSIVNGHTSD